MTISLSYSSKASLIESADKRLRFLIMDAPSDSNLPNYLKEMQKHNVTTLVRVCQPTYDKSLLEKHGIQVVVC